MSVWAAVCMWGRFPHYLLQFWFPNTNYEIKLNSIFRRITQGRYSLPPGADPVCGNHRILDKNHWLIWDLVKRYVIDVSNWSRVSVLCPFHQSNDMICSTRVGMLHTWACYSGCCYLSSDFLHRKPVLSFNLASNDHMTFAPTLKAVFDLWPWVTWPFRKDQSHGTSTVSRLWNILEVWNHF